MDACTSPHLKGYSCQNVMVLITSTSAQLAMRRSEAEPESLRILHEPGRVQQGVGDASIPRLPAAEWLGTAPPVSHMPHASGPPAQCAAAHE
jgi:hypothetical protein